MYFLSAWNIVEQQWISKVQSEIAHLEIALLMSNLLKHANYLNAVLKSLKTRGLTQVPRQQIADA